MKYAIIIPDGAADEPLPQLGGKTPLEVAQTPNIDAIANAGRQGMVRTVPEGFESGSDVAIMTLLGYAPKKYHTGRAPLEAAAQRISLSPTDWVFRCNLVTTIDGIMKDHSAGGISDEDARSLLYLLAREVKEPGFEFHPGVSYRNLLVYRGREEFAVKTKPPHEIPDEAAAKYLPNGKGSDILNRIMDRSRELFANHPINKDRLAKKINPATQVWLWGQGHAPNMPKFAQRFGVQKGAMITGVDLLRGLAVLLGWDVLEVAGMTSFHDTDYIGQGRATAEALDKYDLVFSHIEAPDEASHQADYKTKIEAIEHIDKHIVGPVMQKLKTFSEWRILVMPDHPTLISNRKHGYGPAPFAMAGTNVKSNPKGKYCEKNAAGSNLYLERGEELMEYFLRGGQS
ncbi:MAG TPA: cofactor-independent phosphoglycerate mutase [Tepidisphaeraceae bacterium]|jgi:2,3-bisphosphoglycerate-independent phosphoglycerate mutase|nr:cofactor-independent phosphoglycerate mutase [Tepidisphaeraceae bacterium]